jgi:hypothetical protein
MGSAVQSETIVPLRPAAAFRAVTQALADALELTGALLAFGGRLVLFTGSPAMAGTPPRPSHRQPPPVP